MSKMLTKKESASVNTIHMFTCLTSPVALLDTEVYEATGTVCADTGASQSVGGELMFKFLRNRGQKFSEFHLAMCLADGQQSTSLVQNATVPITVGGRTFQIDLIFLPHAKGNRTLLGVDFLKTSGIVMDMRNNFWYFGDKPSFRIPFSKDVPLPVDDSPVEINSSSCPTNSIPSEIPLHSNTVDEEICELKTIIIDFPTRTANELRTEQLKGLELKKIIDCFENTNKGVDFANWTGRGYVMNQGVLYRYSPHAEVEEAQLVVPTHEREKILKLHHDAPTAAHYGADGTFSRISSKYYWTGMRKFIADYVKSCSECIRYKATNQKPAGLLQTPVPAQRFESIAIDLFWSLTRNDRRYEVDFHSGGLHNKMGRVIPIKASYC
ncbi:transposon Tf2-8 polyprotein [Trichonephila clavipes]|nr:transposon Tf2-8 polyprotein [Trichonephila clavipes]